MKSTEFISDMAALISCETVQGNEAAFEKALAFINSRIDSRAIVKTIGEGDAKVFLAGNTSSKNPDVCFLAHVDVVAGSPAQFSLLQKDDVIYGRGVSDMKFSIPIGLELLNSVIESESELSYVLAITRDEERGGFKGAKSLADDYKLRPKLLIVPDGGDNFVLINKSKGVCQLRITAKGKPAHSSRPWLGENALSTLIQLGNQLVGEYEERNSREGWHTTMNVGKVSGGDNPNQVVPEAEMLLDFRFPPEEDSVTGIKERVSLLAKGCSPNLSVEILAQGESTLVAENHPAILAFSRYFEEVMNRKLTISGGYGSTDARHFNKYGIPFIMIKPEGGDIHGDEEWIRVSSCLLLFELFKRFLESESLAKIL
jgi:succinyl-diaminopimelate desuccinylase